MPNVIHRNRLTDEQWQAFDERRLQRNLVARQLRALGMPNGGCVQRERIVWSDCEREELRTAVPAERPVDGLSPDGSVEEPHPSPSSTLFARDWKSIRKTLRTAATNGAGVVSRIVVRAIAWGIVLAVAIPVGLGILVIVVPVLLMSLADFLFSINGDDHGLYCGCDRCICPDCRMAQIECECQRGDS